MRVLVTGANGFVGRGLLDAISSNPAFEPVAAVRRPVEDLPTAVNTVQIPGLETTRGWDNALAGVNAVVHTAARVHVMNDILADPLTEYRRINVQGTLNLAKQAASAGVRRFVFISSVKVNGESTHPDKPFSAEDTPNPRDAYGISKLEAEIALQTISAQTGMEFVIIRPPLIYGPRAKANFHSMMRVLSIGAPLPLGTIRNQRSLVGLNNLTDLIVTCLRHSGAANQTFLVSDGEDLSTTELLQRTGAALGKPAKLLPAPVWLLKAGAALLGKSDVARRLCDNLQVDISKTMNTLQWSPPTSIDAELQRSVETYLKKQR